MMWVKLIHNFVDNGFCRKNFFLCIHLSTFVLKGMKKLCMMRKGKKRPKGKVNGMLHYFLPNQFVKRVLDITPHELKEKGIKGIITDLDNTLVEWDRPSATPELTEWFEKMKREGIKVMIVSNNNKKRVQSFAEPLGIPFIFEARKPLTRAFQKALATMQLRKEEVVVIGDQLLTDVFGGNRLGLNTILVVPVAQTDGLWTRFNRKMERKILNMMRKKGMVYWEE
jgi:uncharacterized protein